MSRRVRLAGRRIIVTGAASGLGAAAFRMLRESGSRVVGIDIQQAEDVLLADVTEPAQVRLSVARAADSLGGVDVLVNAAGIGWAHSAGREPGEDVRRIFEVNFFGPWNTTASALPWLLEAHGHVINVASGIAVLAMPFGAAYSASKRALTAYSDVLRLEYGPCLAVTAFFPGYLDTPIHSRNLEQGYTVGNVIPQDSLHGAARALVRACRTRPRNASSSVRTDLVMRAGRIWPGPLERAMRARLLKDMATRPLPDFLAADPALGERNAG